MYIVYVQGIYNIYVMGRPHVRYSVVQHLTNRFYIKEI